MASSNTDVSPLDALRAATLGQPIVYKTKSVEVNGQTFELREPSEKKRRRIHKKASAKVEQSDAGGVSATIDVAELRVWCTIEMTYVPGTNTQVFSEKDRDVLMNQPTTGGWFKALADMAWEVYNDEDEDLDAGKSSEEKTDS